MLVNLLGCHLNRKVRKKCRIFAAESKVLKYRPGNAYYGLVNDFRIDLSSLDDLFPQHAKYFIHVVSIEQVFLRGFETCLGEWGPQVVYDDDVAC